MQVLGAVAVFERKRLSEEEFCWVRTLADHPAIALTNARAFAQIQELRRKLENRERLPARGSEKRHEQENIRSSPALRQVLDQIYPVSHVA